MSIESEIEVIVRRRVPAITNDLRSEARNNFEVRSGKLTKDFKSKILMEAGDISGVSFSLPRYGYILHHGVKAGSVTRKGKSYFTKGIKSSGFITTALDKHVADLADEIQQHSADFTVKQIKF